MENSSIWINIDTYEHKHFINPKKTIKAIILYDTFELSIELDVSINWIKRTKGLETFGFFYGLRYINEFADSESNDVIFLFFKDELKKIGEHVRTVLKSKQFI